MPPRVHLVRHAQGYHNISPEGHALLDPQLTDTGKDQARRLQQDFPFYNSIGLILASPIKRAIYTALLGFDEQIHRRGLKVVAMPDLQPTSDRLCDTGVSRHEVAREFEGLPVDLSFVTPGWECGMMPYLVEGWTDDDPSASNHWTNTEYHSCEVGRTSDGHACLIETSESKRRNIPDRSGGTVMELASL
ncbi:hypothetical protein Q7P36_009649 [Cladosporium allicinum]